jgi:RNA recognition motif-containing protein
VGYAFVDLSTPTEADRAINDLNGQSILERKVSIQLARKPEAHAEGANSGGEGASGNEQRRRGSQRGRGGRTRGRAAPRGGRTARPVSHN